MGQAAPPPDPGAVASGLADAAPSGGPSRDRPALRVLRSEGFEFWEQDDDEEATAFLLDWLAHAEASGIKILVGLAKTLRKHALGLLAYYDYPISTGPLDGTNNKIKTMQRQAYGYRDEEFFKLKILAAHEAKYALVG
jgi:hypothetical protein